MRTVGFVALGLVAVLVLAVLVTFILSLPDLARYRRLRKM